MAIAQDLTELGRKIAEMEDEALAARTRAPVEERVAAIHRAHARRVALGQRVRFGRPAAFVAAVAAAAFVVLFSLRKTELRFTVGPGLSPGELGVWVSAPEQDATEIAFSDGSRVRLAAGAQARVVSTTSRGARVVIERGTVRVDVMPRAKNDWSVESGPFEVRVTGTSFDARWEPEREALTVTMHEGHVEVRGTCLTVARALFRGDRETLSCSPKATAARAASATTAVPAVPTEPAASAERLSPSPGSPRAVVGSVAPSRATERGVPSGTAVIPEAPAAPAPSWDAWARLGAYKEALAAAEGEGFGALCATLSFERLFVLATTARLAGKMARANEAYSAVRTRFAGTDGAATAAFHLGQIAFDGARSYPDAHRWFGTYLGERPSGALAAEALGRMMEAEQRMGDLASARVTANRYLQRFPGGVHARLARSLLGP